VTEVGPIAPAGMESNWIKTLPGRGRWVWFRFYAPTEPFFDKVGAYRESRSGLAARRASPFVALFGHPTRSDECPLSGVKRTSPTPAPTSAYDP
jgi:hypothetical protein